MVLIYPKKTTLAARLHLEGYPDGSDEDMALDFVRYMLDLDPVTRPTAAHVLQHPWLHDVDEISEHWKYNPNNIQTTVSNATIAENGKEELRGRSV